MRASYREQELNYSWLLFAEFVAKNLFVFRADEKHPEYGSHYRQLL